MLEHLSKKPVKNLTVLGFVDALSGIVGYDKIGERLLVEYTSISRDLVEFVT